MHLTDDQLHAVLAELRANRKIAAVKLYREYLNTSLADAKNAVEQLADEHQITFAKSGCGTAAALLLALPILVYFFIK